MNASSGNRRLIVLLVVLAVAMGAAILLLVVGSFVLVAVQQGREAARRAQVAANLRQVSEALRNYHAKQNAPRSRPSPLQEVLTLIPSNMEGLWSGPWGGGERNGVFFQPVMAELLITGNHVELVGFPALGNLTGTVRIDARLKQIQITPAGSSSGTPSNIVSFAYQISANELTLIGPDKAPLTLQRTPVARDPLANVDLAFVAAQAISETGDLQLTEFTELRAGPDEATFLQPHERSLTTEHATILLVREGELKELNVDEARRLIREPTPVAVIYRHDDPPPRQQLYRLWKEMGAPRPDSEAVRQMLVRMLRPGTLVFVLSERENVPVP